MITAVCTAGFLEGVGVPWPGAFILAAAAAVAERSVTGVATAAGLFALCYCLGSLIQYAIGWLFGPLALGWLPANHRSKIEQLSEKHGPSLVLWTRPLAVGNYVSLPAGITRMPVLRFVAYTLLGIVPWAVGMALAGRAFGGQIEPLLTAAADWLVPITVLLGAATAVSAAWKWQNARGMVRS